MDEQEQFRAAVKENADALSAVPVGDTVTLYTVTKYYATATGPAVYGSSYKRTKQLFKPVDGAGKRGGYREQIWLERRLVAAYALDEATAIKLWRFAKLASAASKEREARAMRSEAQAKVRGVDDNGDVATEGAA